MSVSVMQLESERLDIGSRARVLGLALIVVLAAESIGSFMLQAGPGQIVLLPLLWALLLGGAIGVAKDRLPRALKLDVGAQHYASAVLQSALLLFIAKLALLVGASLPKIFASGHALLFQEFGHFFGTMVFGLPVALLLGVRREAVGATFSVGREPSLAIIGEKYGMDSPEGRGVLAEYITGTVVGAVFIWVLAGFVAALGVFRPDALAMGAGVGSGSMMAAASAAIAAQQTPEVAKEVAAFAAASNLITTTIGTYFTLFVSLPFANWSYRVLEPVLGRVGLKPRVQSSNTNAEGAIDAAPNELSPAGRAIAWIVTGLLALIGNWLAYNNAPVDALPGLAIMLAVVATGYVLYRLTGSRIPAVCWISLLGMVATYPGVPYAAEISAWTGKINFLALTTPMLAFAGLSIAKDIPAFRRLGWPIVVTSLMANAGTFLGATLIAQTFGH
ncbi:MAG TPA: DUF3100 domain-containing protein [Bradyrhizobium sp.]|uniref:DUF3100 domain-containing protein n=1 Tax=Bradyrhizobium sp. TaxID=376 RepID=UPI002D7EE1C7|nr:DUF3100 domain-containing protein [Bradyrhizobium sp.]HET7886539.1 DUF3100 domain-containing protein [Bradyrhizobium sp.]